MRSNVIGHASWAGFRRRSPQAFHASKAGGCASLNHNNAAEKVFGHGVEFVGLGGGAEVTGAFFGDGESGVGDGVLALSSIPSPVNEWVFVGE